MRLDMTARDKGAPDKGHTTLFSSSKVVHYFPNFRSYFGMEYEQPWNMGKILLEQYTRDITIEETQPWKTRGLFEHVPGKPMENPMPSTGFVRTFSIQVAIWGS